ncbi:hypothetical protein JCM19992_17510 [Thermostilla marina]
MMRPLRHNLIAAAALLLAGVWASSACAGWIASWELVTPDGSMMSLLEYELSQQAEAPPGDLLAGGAFDPFESPIPFPQKEPTLEKWMGVPGNCSAPSHASSSSSSSGANAALSRTVVLGDPPLLGRLQQEHRLVVPTGPPYELFRPS